MSEWVTAPISATCEVLKNAYAAKWEDKFCGQPTFAAYKASGSGWMALCCDHAQKHGEAIHIETLIHDGEEFV